MFVAFWRRRSNLILWGHGWLFNGRWRYRSAFWQRRVKHHPPWWCNSATVVKSSTDTTTNESCCCDNNNNIPRWSGELIKSQGILFCIHCVLVPDLSKYLSFDEVHIRSSQVHCSSPCRTSNSPRPNSRYVLIWWNEETDGVLNQNQGEMVACYSALFLFLGSLMSCLQCFFDRSSCSAGPLQERHL
jgi:hypothetical protein